MDNANSFEDEEISLQSPDVDLDSMADSVEESLKTADELANRLGEINKEMVEYMYHYAQAKASNK